MYRILISLAATLGLCSTALACGIEGTAVRKDGSKVDGTATISTSWNSQTVVPRAGAFQLDLGSGSCGATITVYVDGNNGRSVKVPSSGNARLDLLVK